MINPWGQWDVENFDVDDFGVGLVKFENGATLVLEVSWAANIANPGGSFILGTDGGCHVVGDRIYEQRRGELADTPIKVAQRRRTAFC